jgi:hypothetical protein
VNQGTAVVSTSTGSLKLTTTATDTADSWKLRCYTAPSTPWTLTVYMRASVPAANYSGVSIGWRNSSNGNWLAPYYDYESGFGYNVGVNSGSGNTVVANVIGRISRSLAPWQRITDNGTTLTSSLSDDGTNWTQIYSESRTARITSGPNQIWIGVNPRNSAGGIPTLEILSWKVT